MNYDSDDSCPYLLTESASTNLITYPISFGNSYWTKSGASIEGDSSTAGSELVTNGDFEDGSTDWDLRGGWTIGSGVATNDGRIDFLFYDDFNPTIGKTYRVQYEITDYTSGTSYLVFGGSYLVFSETTIGTFSYTITATSTAAFGVYAGSFIGSIDNVSVKEVQGFEAPKEIPVANGEELVTNGDFEGSSNSWSEGGTWAYGSNNEVCIGNTTNQDLTQSNMTVGNTYLISVDIVSSTLSAQHIRIYAGSVYTDFTLSGVAETIKTQLTATGSGVLDLRVFSSSTSGTLIIDNISVKEVTSWSGGGFEREAYKLVEDTSSGNHTIYALNAVTPSGTQTFTLSAYVKDGGRRYFSMALTDNVKTASFYTFDLQTGTNTQGIDDGTPSTYSIESMPNGWYRISLTTEATYTSKIHPRFYIENTGTPSAPNGNTYTGDGTSGIYIAYAQLEESNYASSLMLPVTEGSTTSRVADAVKNAGNQSLFSGVNSSGTLYAEIAAFNSNVGNDAAITLSNNTDDYRVFFRYDASVDNRIEAYVIDLSGTVASFTAVLDDITAFSKIALRWGNGTNDMSLFVDGVEAATSATGTPDLTLINLRLSSATGGQHFYGKTKAIAVFEYLSDAEMVTLTT